MNLIQIDCKHGKQNILQEEYRRITTATGKANKAYARATQCAKDLEEAAKNSVMKAAFTEVAANEIGIVESLSDRDEVFAVELTTQAIAARELAQRLAETAKKAKIAMKRATVAKVARKATTAEAIEEAAAGVATEAERIEALKTRTKAEQLDYAASLAAEYLEHAAMRAATEATKAIAQAEEIGQLQSASEEIKKGAEAAKAVAEIIAKCAAKAKISKQKTKAAAKAAIKATTSEEGKMAAVTTADTEREAKDIAKEASTNSILELLLEGGIEKHYVLQTFQRMQYEFNWENYYDYFVN